MHAASARLNNKLAERDLSMTLIKAQTRRKKTAGL
jgi:hypothetical protein